MGEITKIEWTSTRHADGTVTPGATFNPWIGCTKVSPGCQHCYAEAFAKRYGKAEWGPQAERVRTSAAYWQQPYAWNKKATAAGKRMKVFCASLADVFEDNLQVAEWRASLWPMIEATDMLDWLLLTKRPENVNELVPARWRNVGRWPSNVWIGTTVENQAMADKRIPELLEVPARVRFLSCEPLLGPVDLSGRTVEGVWIDPDYAALDYNLGDIVRDEGWPIHWVIAGGESGPYARPMNPAWVRGLRDQCVAAGVPFLMKQWGEWRPFDEKRDPTLSMTTPDALLKRWHIESDMWRAGKHAAGRELDGRTWDEYPVVETTVTA